jgi:pyrroloquinoline quinone biosynthesis protein D
MEREWHPTLPRGVRLRHDHIRARWVLLAPERIFEVDGTGVEILKRCDGRAMTELLADLASAFGVTPNDIRGDVEAFLKGFAEKRVLELQ